MVDDDDEVEIIQAPIKRDEASKPTIVSPRPLSYTKKSTSAKVAQSVRIIDDPVDFLFTTPSADRPTSHLQRSSSSKSALSTRLGHLNISQGVDKPTVDYSRRTSPPLSPNSELYNYRVSTPSDDQEYEQALSKTPGIHEAEATVPSRSAGHHSSPTTVSKSVPPSLNTQKGYRINPSINERPFLERWSLATLHLPRSGYANSEGLDAPPPRSPQKTTPKFHPALLPHYLNSQYRNSTTESESDKKTDVWYLAAFGKLEVKDAERQSTEAKAPSEPSQPRRSRKSKALHYDASHNKDHPPNLNTGHASKSPFYFSVDTWMKENKDALTSLEVTVPLDS